MNHVLVKLEGHPNRQTCTVCGNTWDHLNTRDVVMLTTEGKCIGRPERWRQCQHYASKWCTGSSPGHELCVEDTGDANQLRYTTR